MSRADRLRDMVAGLVGAGLGQDWGQDWGTRLGTGVCEIGETADLWPVELLATLPMVPARLAEFAAGRRAARRAMAAAGLSPAPVPMGPDRAPDWPDGVTGSISHSGALAVAVCGGRDWHGLGIDLELDGPQDPDLAATVLTCAEAGLCARLVFCLKEAAYKAQYPVSKQIFGFDQLQVTLQSDRFVARFAAAVHPFPQGFEIHGRFCRADGLILAVAGLR